MIITTKTTTYITTTIMITMCTWPLAAVWEVVPPRAVHRQGWLLLVDVWPGWSLIIMINVLVIQYFDQDRHYLNHSFYRHLNNHIHYPDNYSEPVLCEPCGQEAPWFRLSHSLDLDSERDHCEIVCLFPGLFFCLWDCFFVCPTLLTWTLIMIIVRLLTLVKAI